MAGARDARATGERVEALLAELRTRAGPQAGDAAEELVGCLVELYGAGLTAIVAILGADPDAGPRLLDALAGDPLVESLLLVHDLHPLDADTRINRALERRAVRSSVARGRDRVPRHRRSGRRRAPAHGQRPRVRVLVLDGPADRRGSGRGGGPRGGGRARRGGRGAARGAAAADHAAPGRGTVTGTGVTGLRRFATRSTGRPDRRDRPGRAGWPGRARRPGPARGARRGGGGQ